MCERCVKKHTSTKSSSKNGTSTSKLSCPFCKQSHDLPKMGLAVNDTIMSLLSIKPVDVHRAELYRRVADLIKQMQVNLDAIDSLETASKTTLVDYFELIKREINASTQNLIQQAISYRDKLLFEVECLNETMMNYWNSLVKPDSKVDLLKQTCSDKCQEWSSVSKMSDADEPKLNSIINEAQYLGSKLEDAKCFLQNLMTQKCVFNQREPDQIDMSAMIGEIEFNDVDFFVDHPLKMKLMDDLIEMQTIKYDPTSLQRNVCLVPMLNRKILNVSKTTFDDISDITMTITSTESTTEAPQIYENNENLQCQVNICISYGKYILILLNEKKNRDRNVLKLYNSALKLCATEVMTSERNCEELFMNDSAIYVKIDEHPYAIKYDYEFQTLSLFEKLNKGNELFVSFIVDKLVHFSNNNRIFFVDECFSRIKIFSETSGDLLNSIVINNLRDCLVQVVSSVSAQDDQVIIFNPNDTCLRLYDENGDLVCEKSLSAVLNNIAEFHVTKDGSYVFIDLLNDSIYFY